MEQCLGISDAPRFHQHSPFNRLIENGTYRVTEPGDASGVEATRGRPGRNPRQKQGLTRIDVSDPGNDSLIHQADLHRLAGASEGIPQY